MLESGDPLERVLGLLEAAVGGGSQYLEALVTAIREERDAARHGPAPRHAGLQKLGYVGWSQLLSHRPSQ
jgi:hypothetical protein